MIVPVTATQGQMNQTVEQYKQTLEMLLKEAVGLFRHFPINHMPEGSPEALLAYEIQSFIRQIETTLFEMSHHQIDWANRPTPDLVKMMNGLKVEKVFFKADFMFCEKPNKNRRLYQSSVGEAIFRDFEPGKLYGYLGRYESSERPLSMQSHVVKSIAPDSTGLVYSAVIETLDTFQGKLAASLLVSDKAGTYTLRPTGTGTIIGHENGVDIIGSDYKLISIDIVTDLEAS